MSLEDKDNRTQTNYNFYPRYKLVGIPLEIHIYCRVISVHVLHSRNLLVRKDWIWRLRDRIALPPIRKKLRKN